MSGTELMMAAAVVSAIGTLQEGQAARSEAEAEARNREREAQIAREQARARANEQRRDGAARLARARVRLAGRGARLEGTPLDVLGQIGSESALDALDAEHAGQLQSDRNLTQAAAGRRRGATAYRRARSRAGASLLRGFA